MAVRHLGAVCLMLASLLGACDMTAKTQVPTHVAEFTMPTSDYPLLLAALDGVAASFGVKRVNAAPGLKELHGREVLFGAYMAQDPQEWRSALEVNDIYGPGKVLLRVYGDYFDDAEQRTRFLTEVSVIVQRFGGALMPNRPASK